MDRPPNRIATARDLAASPVWSVAGRQALYWVDIRRTSRIRRHDAARGLDSSWADGRAGPRASRCIAEGSLLCGMETGLFHLRPGPRTVLRRRQLVADFPRCGHAVTTMAAAIGPAFWADEHGARHVARRGRPASSATRRAGPTEPTGATGWSPATVSPFSPTGGFVPVGLAPAVRGSGPLRPDADGMPRAAARFRRHENRHPGGP